MSGFCGNVQRPPSALKQQGLCFHTHFQPCAPPLAILSYSFSIYNVDVKPSLCVSNTASLSLRWKMAWMVIGFYIKIEAVEDFDFTAKQNLHTAKLKKTNDIFRRSANQRFERSGQAICRRLAYHSKFPSCLEWLMFSSPVTKCHKQRKEKN